MDIQWFPGHMHATRKALRERLRTIDVVVELLDARIPGSSANPMLAEMAVDKPILKVLNKADLADPKVTPRWLHYYARQQAVRAIAVHAHMPGLAKILVRECRGLAPQRLGMAKPLRVLMAGIPNVGKSTLFNVLLGRRLAKTADEPGVTRREQRVALADDVYLFDTPGLLWPKIVSYETGWRLAATGAIGRNAYDEEQVALALLAWLQREHPDRLLNRYRLSMPIAELQICLHSELLLVIGQRRGALSSGGIPDRHKASEALLTDLRTGALGRLTLETPETFEAWTGHVCPTATRSQAAGRSDG